MEPKFKEITRRDPNIDLKNIPMNAWPIEDKIQAIAGGPIAAVSKAGVFDKVREALKIFYNAWKNYTGKLTPMIPKAGISKDSKQQLTNGGKIY